MKTVVVVGGGFYGIRTANNLVSSANVILISVSKFTYFIPASIRVAVYNQPDGVVFPIEDVLNPKVTLVQGKVTCFNDEKVVVNGEDLKFDVLVLATGSKWSDPISTPLVFGDDYKSYFEEQHEKIINAKHIVLVGGGLVNTELAGELLDKFADELTKGRKRITLVQSSSKLLPDNGFYGERLRNRVTEYFNDSPIDLKLNTQATISDDGVTLTTGETIKAELVLSSLGVQPQVPSTQIPELINSAGFVTINDNFQSMVSPKIFSIGDCSSYNFQGVVYNAKWVSALVANVESVLNDEPPTVAIAKQNGPVACVVVLGRDHGSGQVPTPFGIVPLPEWVCVWKKCRRLFVDEAKSMFSA